MKIIVVLLVCLFLIPACLLAQSTDTLWEVSYAVGLRWHQDVKATKSYSINFWSIDEDGNDLPSTILYKNNLEWEDDTLHLYVWALYDGKTCALMQTANVLDRDSTKSIEERCAILHQEIFKYAKNVSDWYIDTSSSETKTTLQKIGNNAYYCFDARLMVEEKITEYDYSQESPYVFKSYYRPTWERYMLLDNVLYKIRLDQKKQVSLSELPTRMEAIRPTFDRLVNNVVINENNLILRLAWRFIFPIQRKQKQ